MGYSYQQYQTNLIELGKLLQSQIYFYDSSELSSEYDLFFQWAQDDLHNKAEHYGGLSATLYYNSSTEVNAHTPPPDTLDYIGIYRGLFEDTYLLFLSSMDCLPAAEGAKFKKQFSVDLWKFRHQLVLRFVYFHELGHLIQNKFDFGIDLTKPFLEPRILLQPSNYLKEYDADVYGSLRLVEYFGELWNELSQTDKSIMNFQLLLENVVISILCFFIMLQRCCFELKVEAHPHPAVRFTYIIRSFFKEVQNKYKHEVAYNKDEVIRNACSHVEQIFKDETWILNSLRHAKSDRYCILKYIKKELETGAIEFEQLIVNRLSEVL